MISIMYCSYCKPSKSFLSNQKHNQHVRSAYFVQFAGYVWEDNIMCHMWINHDIETTRDFLFFFFTAFHYADCLMPGVISLLTFEL